MLYCQNAQIFGPIKSAVFVPESGTWIIVSTSITLSKALSLYRPDTKMGNCTMALWPDFFSKNHDYGAFLPLKSAKILFKRITLLLTDYRRPMKLFFIETQTFGLRLTIWADKLWGIWVHTSQNSFYKWTKISSLQITIFYLKMMVKSGLDFLF